MLEFGDSTIVTSGYFIGSAILIGLNGLFLAGLLLRRDQRSASGGGRVRMRLALGVGVLALVIGLGAGLSSLVAPRPAAAVSAVPNGISIDEIHRRIDMKQLPVEVVPDFM